MRPPRAAALLALLVALPVFAAEERPGNAQVPEKDKGAEKAQEKPKPKAPPKPFPEPEGGLPAGTVRVRLLVGQTFALAIPGGTQVICDDPSVAKSEFGADSIVLAAQGPGATMCGARLAGAPKGLWYVVVEAK